MANEKAAAAYHPGRGVGYLVMCGVVREPVQWTPDQEHAHDLARAHEDTHHCTPWVQYPLEHGHDRG